MNNFSYDGSGNSGTKFYKLQGFVNKVQNEDKCFYLACPDCKKKVLDDPFGYRCENCQKTVSSANASYILTAKISDFSGNLFVQFMQDAGDHVMNGISAEQFKELKELSSAEQMKEFFQ